MRLVLSISTVLGVIGVVAAFGLFYLAERVFHMDRLTVQTLMYLKLSVAGHLTIFLTRTRGPFWSIRPAKTLWIAVLGTQAVATLIAVYGLFMAPLGWKWAGFVWAYALVWALINDRIKLLAYKIFDPVKAEAKPQAAADAKPESKAEPKPEAKVEPKPEVKTEPKPESKALPDLTQQIAKRAFELYGERDRSGGTAVQDWTKAEQEIRNVEPKSEPKPQAEADLPKPEEKAPSRPVVKVDASKPDAKADDPKLGTKADEPKPEAKADQPTPDAKDKTRPEVSPELVKRVHEFYEELGRKDVQAVQELENAELEPEKHEVHK
jgi:H+-transporting ATPase